MEGGECKKNNTWNNSCEQRRTAQKQAIFIPFYFLFIFALSSPGRNPPPSVLGRVSRAASLSGPQYGLRPLYGISPSQYALRVILLTESGIYRGRSGGIQRPSVRALGDLVDRAADRTCHLWCKHADGASAARLRTVRPRLGRVPSTCSAWGLGASRPAPPVRTVRGRLVHVSCTYPTEAPGAPASA